MVEESFTKRTGVLTVREEVLEMTEMTESGEWRVVLYG